ncbi:hypothetical protein GBAR_LOCUS30458, partial [Geodia barretti]
LSAFSSLHLVFSLPFLHPPTTIPGCSSSVGCPCLDAKPQRPRCQTPVHPQLAGPSRLWHRLLPRQAGALQERGAAGDSVQPTDSHRPPHHGAQEDVALLGHALVERQLGVETAPHRPRRGQAGVPVSLRRPKDPPRVYRREHLALVAQRQGPAGRRHVREVDRRSHQQPPGMGGGDNDTFPPIVTPDERTVRCHSCNGTLPVAITISCSLSLRMCVCVSLHTLCTLQFCSDIKKINLKVV